MLGVTRSYLKIPDSKGNQIVCKIWNLFFWEILLK